MCQSKYLEFSLAQHQIYLGYSYLWFIHAKVFLCPNNFLLLKTKFYIFTLPKIPQLNNNEKEEVKEDDTYNLMITF